MLPKMVDMAKTMEEMQETAGIPYPSSAAQLYPYGLSICLGHDELEKLGLEADCEPGDLIHMFAMAKVTSVSKNDTGEGPKCRVELQITHLGLEEEDEEDEAEEDTFSHSKLRKKMYAEG